MDNLARVVRLCLCAFAACLISAPGQALNIEIRGDVALLSGALEFRDQSALQALASKGVRAVVMREIRSGDVYAEHIIALARVLEKQSLTTVLDGPCGPVCAILFMAGKERRFLSQPPFTLQGVLIRGSTEEYSRRPSDSTDIYAYFSNRIGDTMPAELINRYTNGMADAQGGVIFETPIKAFPNGRVLECEDIRKYRECPGRYDISTVGAGILTHAEPFVHPQFEASTESLKVEHVRMTHAYSPSKPLSDPTEKFTIGQTVFAVVELVWNKELVVRGGAQEFEVRWYNGGQSVRIDRRSTVFQQPNGRTAFSIPAKLLKAGDCRVELYAGGVSIAEKRFTVASES